MSCLRFLDGPDSSLCLVVKVKYEDTLRRFNIYIREYDRPDISFNALRSKICSLFHFNLNSDIIITYTDEDNDIINMVDEDDLLDAVRQRLNPLRLEVSFTGQKGIYAKRQRLNAMRSSSKTSSLKTNAIPKGDNQAYNGTTPTLNEQENGNDCMFQAGPHNHFGPSTPSLSIESNFYRVPNCHHGPENLSGPSASPISRDVSGPSKMTFGIFHEGVQCDGYRMNPIEGPCYASKMKNNHDLFLQRLLACFNEMAEVGNGDEYAQIVHPTAMELQILKGEKCHGCGSSPIVEGVQIKAEDDCDRKVGFVDVYRGNLFDTSSSVGEMENRSPGKLNCCLVKDDTIYSGPQILAPGTHFTKIWRLHNTGTRPWPQHTQLIKCEGSDFGAGNEVKLEIPEQGFPVDEDFDAVVHFIAPMQPGKYYSCWRLMAPSGPKFGQQVSVAIQVVESSKEGVLPLPLKSVLTTKHPDGNAGSFQDEDVSFVESEDDEEVSFEESESEDDEDEEVSFDESDDGNAGSFQGEDVSFDESEDEEKVFFYKSESEDDENVSHDEDEYVSFDESEDEEEVSFDESESESESEDEDVSFDESEEGEDVCFDECVSPYPMKSVQTTKDTDGKVVLFGVDISLKYSDEKAILCGENMNLKLSNVVSIPDGASMIEQLGQKASGVTVQDIDVPVIIPDGDSIDEHPGEKASGLTVQDSDAPIQLQGVSMDTASARDPILAAASEWDSNLPEIATESDPSLEIAAEWDLILEELQEMGFYDGTKDRGSKIAVLDLLSAERG